MISEDQIYKKAVELWGKRFQSDMMIEKSVELIKVILKDRWGKIDTADKIIEELVDVEIMLNQMRTIMNDESKYKQWKIYKLDRLQQLIESDDNFKGW